ncbi:MAG: type I methionyl aminopeptidase [Psychromonas sp.]|nr:type I methionyl aminopeptidase [Psychromonas sp.]
MATTIKTADEIKKMRIAGQLAADVLTMIAPFVVKGTTTNELNELCHNFIIDEQQAIPAPLNYHGFPKSICTSVNQVVCHGIPNDKQLKDGDIVNLDITVIKDGYHGDTSEMFIIGKSIAGERLAKIAQECLYLGIHMVKPGAQLGDIGEVIQKHAEKNICSVVRDYCGHGIGLGFHEDPQVLHYGKKGTGQKIEVGQCFTIEPMINLGRKTEACKVLNDKWTVETKKKVLSAQWEHTLLVTEMGVEILTIRPGEKIERYINHS